MMGLNNIIPKILVHTEHHTVTLFGNVVSAAVIVKAQDEIILD